MKDMTEQECRLAWEKHQKNAHEDDMMPYSEFRSNNGLVDEEEEEDAWDDDGYDEYDDDPDRYGYMI